MATDASTPSSPTVDDLPPSITTSFASSTIVISNITSLIPIKLSPNNYLFWKSLFEPTLRGHKLMHLIDGKTPSPIASTSVWYEKNQMLLSWINATLSKSVLPYMIGISSAKVAWDTLKQHYASTTPAHIMSLKRKISRIKKGNQSMSEYLQQFKNIFDQLAVFGSPISDDDLNIYVLERLPPSYRRFGSSICIRACTTTLSLPELHTLLICEELALADEPSQEVPSVFVATKPRRTSFGCRSAH
ncbi:hypothetical protein NE237_019135 [Protea cynaroides]|uniref:Retrotransposon Copia-like N-terminal domain-containing protein n=1 Tax=Protea cynaroides TaxID=273540 RepID=A0A9Q0KB78_9MAGN|nr:hypothetical protein NE237_019135 [Protea cynaroides]